MVAQWNGKDFANCRKYRQPALCSSSVLAPLPPSQAIVAGGLAGAISAVVTQPIDTVMAQAQGLESAKFRNTFACARDIVRAGGVRALYFGLSTRTARVFCEVGLQFSLYEQISPWLDRALG